MRVAKRCVAASRWRSHASPRDTKETELFEARLRHDALDPGLGVMRECDCRIDSTSVEDPRDPALQVLPHPLALVQRQATAHRPGRFGRPAGGPDNELS
jgi:hypothetical protein